MTTPQKVALVTGAGSGIGAVTAAELISKGFNVYAMDLNAKNRDGQTIAAAIRHEFNEMGLGSSEEFDESLLHSFTGDITDEHDLERLHDQISKEQGHVDAVINNAGISLPMIPGKTEANKKNEEKLNAVNVEGTKAVTRIMQPLLEKSKDVGNRLSPSVTNISSITTKVGIGPPETDPNSLYAKSKQLVNKETADQAGRLDEHGIRFNAVLPGMASQTNVTQPWEEIMAPEKMRDPISNPFLFFQNGEDVALQDIANAVYKLITGNDNGEEVIVDNGALEKMKTLKNTGDVKIKISGMGDDTVRTIKDRLIGLINLAPDFRP